jgi:uncharacterized protein
MQYTIVMEHHVERLKNCVGFQWDDANVDKNWLKHGVTPAECEQIFFNQPLLIENDERHSQEEDRYYALGQTDAGRLLFVVFTVREMHIRPVSARDMSRKERKAYLCP